MSGRKPLKFDPEVAKNVVNMAAFGLPQEDIARLVNMSMPTLRKLYLKELNSGAAKANFEVGKMLFQKCMDGDTTAMIFWAKTRMGWRDKTKPEIKLAVNSRKEANQVLLQLREVYGIEEMP